MYYNRPIILIGKSGSGKTTVANCLVNHFGFQQIKTYTTRPKRTDELDDAYHFITNAEFDALKKSDFFAESYQKILNNGVRIQYGSAKEDYALDANKVIILTPMGMQNAVKSLGVMNTSVIYLKMSDDILLERLHNRNSETNADITTRLAQEAIDFDHIEPSCDFVINRNNLDSDNVADLINRYNKGLLY